MIGTIPFPSPGLGDAWEEMAPLRRRRHSRRIAQRPSWQIERGASGVPVLGGRAPLGDFGTTIAPLDAVELGNLGFRFHLPRHALNPKTALRRLNRADVLQLSKRMHHARRHPRAGRVIRNAARGVIPVGGTAGAQLGDAWGGVPLGDLGFHLNFKKLGKSLGKVAKVAAIAAATYYGGGAIVGAIQRHRAASQAQQPQQPAPVQGPSFDPYGDAGGGYGGMVPAGPSSAPSSSGGGSLWNTIETGAIDLIKSKAMERASPALPGSVAWGSKYGIGRDIPGLPGSRGGSRGDMYSNAYGYGRPGSEYDTAGLSSVSQLLSPALILGIAAIVMLPKLIGGKS